MHEKRGYVKLGHGRYRQPVRLVLPLLVALWAAAPAQAFPLPQSEGAEEAQLVGDPTGPARAHLAFVKGRDLYTDSLGADWLPSRKAQLPDETGRIAGVRAGAALVESRSGTWLRLYLNVGEPFRFREITIADAPKRGLLGPAGLTLNRRRQPTVAYSLRRSDGGTELWLVQVTRHGSRVRVGRTRVTRNGFPISVVPPAAQPVLLPNGTLRVVQTFTQRGANAIFWRREGQRWWGRVLHASSLGVAPFPIAASLAGGESVYLAWTVVHAVQRELQLVLTSRTDRSRSIVLHRNAIAAGLVLGPNGPEVAANENVAGLTAGLVFFPAIVTGILPSPPLELDGRIVGYTRDREGAWQLLLVRNGRLEWFTEPSFPSVRIILEGPSSGRVEGAAGGVVRLYRERAGAPRELVSESPVDANGRFSTPDPAPQSGTHYRFVYERDQFAFPYALLVREPAP